MSTNSPQHARSVLDTSQSEGSLEGSDSSAPTNTHSQLRVAPPNNQYSHEAHMALNTEGGLQFACREDDADTPRHTLSLLQKEISPPCCPTAENPRQLVEVTSNVMASKFKMQGLTDKVPADMGSIVIKTSFLHIQPRKVVAFLPHPDLSDSGIDTDSSSSSDESSNEEGLPSAEVFMEPETTSIEGLVSMEELQLPKSIELESQTLRPIDTSQQVQQQQAVKLSSYKTQRMSVSDSHIQIHSKTPTWNEQHMIYQLDFGGRVTTKSAKNFQLELDGEQVGTCERLCVFQTKQKS